MKERDRLNAFYQSFKERSPSDLLRFADLKGPDLIWLDDEFLNASRRVVIIGQQAGDWGYTYPKFITSVSVADAVLEYQKFDFAYGKEYREYLKTPFWQFFHQIRSIVFPTEPDLRRRVLWSNLVKFVASDKTSILLKPYGEEALRLQDDVLKTELSIVKPHICIFVTGPHYDDVLKRYYPGVLHEEMGLLTQQFARLKHPELPEHTYRTYHPRYLRQGHLWAQVMPVLARELG